VSVAAVSVKEREQNWGQGKTMKTVLILAATIEETRTAQTLGALAILFLLLAIYGFVRFMGRHARWNKEGLFQRTAPQNHGKALQIWDVKPRDHSKENVIKP
jgi:hypothetical protein